MWQCPGGPRKRRTGRSQVAGRPRGHVGARVGRQMEIPVIEEIETLNRGIHSPIYTRQFVFFSPCGTMFPHGLTLHATWTCGERRISSWTATIAWTRVHAISKSGTCRKYKGKWPDLRTYLTTRGRLSIVRSSSSLIHRQSGSWTSPRCTDGGDASRHW